MDTINTSIDTNSVDKKKKSFLPKLFIAMTSVLSIIVVGASLLIKDTYKSARAVSYDDDDYIISLNADELNNYQFSNLSSLLYDNLQNITLTYNTTNNIYSGVYYSTQDFDGYAYCYQNEDDYQIVFIYNFETWKSEEGIISNDFRLGQNNFFLPNFGNVLFDATLDIECNDLSYQNIKNAIEQDIAANLPYDNNTFLQDIIELLVGGIGVTANGIGTGLSVLVSNIAIQNGAMSPFMALVLIFGGLALALGLSRWVVNLIGSLGQRNR